MSKVTFYRQKRFDGGIRTGIDIDGDRALHHYEPGKGDENPALQWYVDLRISGDLPDAPDELRAWLLGHASKICNALNDLSRKHIGTDEDLVPFQAELPTIQKGVKIVVVWSAVRRVNNLEFTEVLRQLAVHFVEYVNELELVTVQ